MSEGTPGCQECAELPEYRRPCEPCREAQERPTRPLPVGDGFVEAFGYDVLGPIWPMVDE